MEASTATLIAGTLGIIGVLLGVMIERLMRLAGLVRCVTSVQSLTLTGVEDSEGYERPLSLANADESTKASGVSYVFVIDFFNGKEMPTGLRNASVVLVRDDGKRIPSLPLGEKNRSLEVINLAARQFEHHELRGGFGKKAANALTTGRWKRILFEAERPKRPLLWRKTYRKTITERSDWSRS